MNTYTIAATYKDFENSTHEASGSMAAMKQRYPDAEIVRCGGHQVNGGKYSFVYLFTVWHGSDIRCYEHRNY